MVGSALATVPGQIGGVLAAHFNGEAADWGTADSLSDDIDDIEIPELSNFFTILKGQATGAISGFPAAELGEALGLDGSDINYDCRKGRCPLAPRIALASEHGQLIATQM